MIPALVLGPGTERRALAAALSGEPLHVSSAGGLDEVAPGRLEHRPELVVLCGPADGAALSPRICAVRERWPRAGVVVVCRSIADRDLRAALAAGARGIVLGAEAPGALGPCLKAVRAGQVCVPSRGRRQLQPPVLSSREKQILGLVVMGCMNSEIAARLFLAESTVKSHLSSAFAKLGVRSRYEAAEVITDPARGLSPGILALGARPLGDEVVSS